MEKEKKTANLINIKNQLNQLDKSELFEILRFIGPSLAVWQLESVTTSQYSRLIEGEICSLKKVIESGYNDICLEDINGDTFEFYEEETFVSNFDKKYLNMSVKVIKTYRDCADFLCIKVESLDDSFTIEEEE